MHTWTFRHSYHTESDKNLVDPVVLETVSLDPSTSTISSVPRRMAVLLGRGDSLPVLSNSGINLVTSGPFLQLRNSDGSW